MGSRQRLMAAFGVGAEATARRRSPARSAGAWRRCAGRAPRAPRRGVTVSAAASARRARRPGRARPFSSPSAIVAVRVDALPPRLAFMPCAASAEQLPAQVVPVATPIAAAQHFVAAVRGRRGRVPAKRPTAGSVGGLHRGSRSSPRQLSCTSGSRRLAKRVGEALTSRSTGACRSREARREDLERGAQPARRDAHVVDGVGVGAVPGVVEEPEQLAGADADDLGAASARACSACSPGYGASTRHVPIACDAASSCMRTPSRRPPAASRSGTGPARPMPPAAAAARPASAAPGAGRTPKCSAATSARQLGQRRERLGDRRGGRAARPRGGAATSRCRRPRARGPAGGSGSAASAAATSRANGVELGGRRRVASARGGRSSVARAERERRAPVDARRRACRRRSPTSRRRRRRPRAVPSAVRAASPSRRRRRGAPPAPR